MKQQQQHRSRVIQLWSLLPAFCSHPVDIATSFANLAPILANALQDAKLPELLNLICQSLQLLVQAVQDSGNEKDLEALSTLSKKFLPTLFTILDNTSPEDPSNGLKIRALSDTISAYALIAPTAFVASLFKKLVQKMLEATQVRRRRQRWHEDRRTNPFLNPSNLTRIGWSGWDCKAICQGSHLVRASHGFST